MKSGVIDSGNFIGVRVGETRKNQVIVTVETLREGEQTCERRNYSKNHYRRPWNFHTFEIPSGRRSFQRGGGMGAPRGGEGDAPRQKEQEPEQLFDFRATFPLSRGPGNVSKGRLTALIVPVVSLTVYSDFHPVFFLSRPPLLDPCSPFLFFQSLPTRRCSNNCYSTLLLVKQSAERAHLVSQTVIRDSRKTIPRFSTPPSFSLILQTNRSRPTHFVLPPPTA